LEKDRGNSLSFSFQPKSRVARSSGGKLCSLITDSLALLSSPLGHVSLDLIGD
ncbi:hypothetical protein ACTXT7_005376, partial [Hymenolepis weldensis]